MAKGLRMVSVTLSGHGVSRGSKANRTVAEDGGGEMKTKGRWQGRAWKGGSRVSGTTVQPHTGTEFESSRHSNGPSSRGEGPKCR